MRAEERRKGILKLLGNSQSAVSAKILSDRFSVSRQVIVQDVAILRANGFDVISTNRGYLLGTNARAERVFKCRHTFEQIADESNIIIDNGGTVEDVFVNHRVYGRITARLDLKSKTDVEELYRSLLSGASKPLMSVTDGFHYHTVSADSEEQLDGIERTLKQAGYLIES